MAIVSKGKSVVTRFLGSGVVFPNNASSDGANAVGETVTSMSITHAQWSCANGAYFTVARGANTIAYYSNAGAHDYQSQGIIDGLGGEPFANVVVTKVGSGPCFLSLRLHKKSVTG